MELANDNIITRFKRRRIDKNFIVAVKRRKNLWTVRQKGVIVAHAQRLCLKDAKFWVDGSITGYIEESGCGTTAKATNKAGEVARLPVKIVYDYLNRRFVSSEFVPQIFIESAEFIILNEYGIFGAYTNS